MYIYIAIDRENRESLAQRIFPLSLRKSSLMTHLVFREIATILKHWSQCSSLVLDCCRNRFAV